MILGLVPGDSAALLVIGFQVLAPYDTHLLTHLLTYISLDFKHAFIMTNFRG